MDRCNELYTTLILILLCFIHWIPKYSRKHPFKSNIPFQGCGTDYGLSRFTECTDWEVFADWTFYGLGLWARWFWWPQIIDVYIYTYTSASHMILVFVSFGSCFGGCSSPKKEDIHRFQVYNDPTLALLKLHCSKFYTHGFVLFWLLLSTFAARGGGLCPGKCRVCDHDSPCTWVHSQSDYGESKLYWNLLFLLWLGSSHPWLSIIASSKIGKQQPSTIFNEH